MKDGKPMRDNNFLSPFIKPAARTLGLGFVNWRCLRTSYGAWLKRHGADMKDIRVDASLVNLDDVQDIPESCRRGWRNCLFQRLRFSGVLGRKSFLRGSQVIENMVARDGIEPPPAFSGLE